MSDVIRLLDEHEVEPQRSRKFVVEVPVWWFIAVVLLQVAGLVYAQYDRSGMRRELDENAALLKQIQEMTVVKSLPKIK